ncbi:spermine/spermidine synthase family protein [Burkholderia pseudomallei]|nr:spermine/spermidine synthase family protein [Burkholderia pseudomallei]
MPSLETMIERANALADRHSVDLGEAAVRIELGASYDWSRFGEPVDA